MEISFLTVRCFLNPIALFQAAEIVAPVPVPRKNSDIPIVTRSPIIELKPRPHSTEPTPSTKLRISPVPLSQEYHRQLIALKDKFRRAFKNFEAVKNAADLIKREIVSNAAPLQEIEWGKLCQNFKLQVGKSAGSISIGKQLMGDLFDIDACDGEILYTKVLHFRLGKIFEAHADMLRKFDMFSNFPPIVMYIGQKEYTQTYIVPSAVESYMSYAEAVKMNLIPSNLESYMEIDTTSTEKWKLCCVGLFHSFVHRVNFVSAYWRSDVTQVWKHLLVNFDRHESPPIIVL